MSSAKKLVVLCALVMLFAAGVSRGTLPARLAAPAAVTADGGDPVPKPLPLPWPWLASA